ncbi:hypothetical protein MGYG_05031 [Nannizzia gypsea CBS 118893]|uniref:Uncharacterized protein n=1 Tax=Arthroderma gypseum (strain ATCC MYA-4604 / CBS 118893) TaxID=535722 RepID=E4UY66_ARTGP|nr:hypothetical protein MGYG_05031 [Nannizzia gypsea CBS 118893]EFR02029.1 hypothetical protein MGYG_05031 [Nannizzia gypsea CBS 118893]
MALTARLAGEALMVLRIEQLSNYRDEGKITNNFSCPLPLYCTKCVCLPSSGVPPAAGHGICWAGLRGRRETGDSKEVVK